MRGFVLSLCATYLLLSVATAQSKAPSKPAPPQKSTTASTSPSTKEAENAAITIDGLCHPGTPGGKAYSKSCKTVISNAEMDKLITALNPDMTPPVRQNLGRQYAEWVAYSAKARELGLDKSEDYAEIVKFARTQLLAQMLARKYQKDAETISPAELQAYYDSHKKDFEEFNFVRVIVPKPLGSSDKPVDETAEKQFADQIRERLVKGEDAKALQTEAFKHAGQQVPEPSVELTGRKRNSFPPSQASIFDLKDGEVSQVLPDPSAYFIYKLVSHTVTPLDKATAEVKKSLAKERLEKAVNELNSQFDVKLSEEYFGPQPQAPASAPSIRTPNANPSAPKPPSSTSPVEKNAASSSEEPKK